MLEGSPQSSLEVAVPISKVPTRIQPAAALEAERRGSTRRRIVQRCFVRLRGVTGPSGWRGIAYNISPTGIGIALPLPLWRGVSLTIEPYGIRDARTLRAQVAHVRPFEWAWLCGCELAERLPERELRAWLVGGPAWD
jgi:hypothetical protein